MSKPWWIGLAALCGIASRAGALTPASAQAGMADSLAPPSKDY